MSDGQVHTKENGVGTIEDFPGLIPASSDRPTPASDPDQTDPGSIEDFPGLVPANVSDSSELEAAAAGVVKGGVEGTGMFAGGASGVKLGLKVPGPFPVKVGAAIIGGITGAIVGHEAASSALVPLSEIKLPTGAPLTYKSIEDVPHHLRSAFIFGENVGTGASFMGGTIVGAKKGVKVLSESFIGRTFNAYMDLAKNKTKRFLAMETISSVGSGVGGAMAEATAPGELAPRLLAEVIGGIITPGKLIVSGADFMWDRMRNLHTSLSAAARETEVARIIQQAYVTAGEDPVLASKLLQNALTDPDLTKATPAQVLGDDAMVAVEAALIKQSAEFSVEAGQKAEATLEMFKQTIKMLRGTGDPSMVREAAILEERLFRTLMSEKINAVLNKAADDAAKIATDSVADKSRLSLQVYNQAVDALDQSRAIEKTLWDVVPTDVPARTDSIFKVLSSLKGRMLADEKVPEIVSKTIARYVEAGGDVTTGELKLFRSAMLRLAREAGSNPERANEASIMGHLAEAALDDMDLVFKGADTGILRTFGSNMEAYDKARRFSAGLHEAFTNAFTGAELKTIRKGLRQAPEALMKRAMAGGGEATAWRLRELEESTRFLPMQDLGGPEASQTLDLMMDAQKRYVAVFAAEMAIIKDSGLVTTTGVANFISKNPDLMRRFPNVRNLLETARSSQKAAEALEKAWTQGSRIVANKATFSKFASLTRDVPEDAVTIIRKALTGDSPEKSLKGMFKLAKKGGPEAIEGFNAGVMDYAIDIATDVTGTINFTKLRAALFEPVSAGKSSVMDTMESLGSMTPEAVAGWKKILNKADKLIKAGEGGAFPIDVEGVSDGLTTMIVRAAGARAATETIGKGGGGSSLVIASGGAN
jgi:hypothetical protein